MTFGRKPLIWKCSNKSRQTHTFVLFCIESLYFKNKNSVVCDWFLLLLLILARNTNSCLEFVCVMHICNYICPRKDKYKCLYYFNF